LKNFFLKKENFYLGKLILRLGRREHVDVGTSDEALRLARDQDGCLDARIGQDLVKNNAEEGEKKKN